MKKHLWALAAAVLVAHQGSAHAVAGARVFVNTLEIDDPGVGDEANLPILSAQSPDGKTVQLQSNWEYDKTITSNFGVAGGFDYDLTFHDQADGNKTHGGFGTPYVQAKYRWILLPEHEFVSSVQVQRGFGRAGTAGFDDGFNFTTFSGYFGKGLGDIPWNPIRPFAVTGELDYSVPDAGLASGAGDVTTWSGGLTLQYSIPYLQSQIKDQGFGAFFGNLTPLAEIGWSSAAGRSAFTPTNHPTSFLLGTGAVWTGDTSSVSTELLWPLNGAAGHGIGIIGQFHLYFDDSFPDSLGKPLLGS
jgi:hypothetical protein